MIDLGASHTGGREGLVHEPLFGETEPELGGLAIIGAEDLLHQPGTHLLPGLSEVLPHEICMKPPKASKAEPCKTIQNGYEPASC